MANTKLTLLFLGEKLVKASVILYIKPYENTCHTQISLALSVDHWWYEKQGYTTLRLTNDLPPYMALYAKDIIAAKLQGQSCQNWQLDDLYVMANNWITESFTKLEPQWRLHLEKLWNKTNHTASNDSKMSIEEVEILQQDARLLLPYIEGRRWLTEHLEKRLKMLGVRLAGASNSEQYLRTYLPSVLQLLFLQKEIEITAGVTMHQHQNKLQAQCERCGSKDYGINLHYCSLCNHEDLVCDTCFVMGVSKGCSIVISRAKQIDYTIHSKNKRPILKSPADIPNTKHWIGEL